MAYSLQSVDLGAIAGAQSQPLGNGLPICSIMVLAAPTGFTATIQDAQNGQPIPLPPAGQGIQFDDPIVSGLVVVVPKGQAGILLLGLKMSPAGFSSSSPGGVAFKGSGMIVDNGLNAGGIVQLLNPVGSGVVATVTRVEVVKSGATGGGLYLAADVGAGVVGNGNQIGGAIQPMSTAALAAGIASKLIYRFRQDGATPAAGVGIPGQAVHNLNGDAGQHGGDGLDPAGSRWTLTPGYGLVLRGAGNDNTVWTLNTEHTEQ